MVVEIDQLKRNYINKNSSFEEVFALLKRTNQQHYLLSWNLASKEFSKYLQNEIPLDFFLEDSYSSNPTSNKIKYLKKEEKVCQNETIPLFPEILQEKLEKLKILFQIRCKREPFDYVLGLYWEMDTLKEFPWGNLSERVINNNILTLKKMVILYAYIPELFWHFLPKNKNGSFRKNAVVCFWSINIGTRSVRTLLDIPYNFGLYLKMWGTIPVIELNQRPIGTKNYQGYRFFSALPEDALKEFSRKTKRRAQEEYPFFFEDL